MNISLLSVSDECGILHILDLCSQNHGVDKLVKRYCLYICFMSIICGDILGFLEQYLLYLLLV